MNSDYSVKCDLPPHNFLVKHNTLLQTKQSFCTVDAINECCASELQYVQLIILEFDMCPNFLQF